MIRKICPRMRRLNFTNIRPILRDCGSGSSIDSLELQPQIALFIEPLSAAVSEQRSELQLELCELQSKPLFKWGALWREFHFGICFPNVRSHSSKIGSLTVLYVLGRDRKTVLGGGVEGGWKERNRLTNGFFIWWKVDAQILSLKSTILCTNQGQLPDFFFSLPGLQGGLDQYVGELRKEYIFQNMK